MRVNIILLNFSILNLTFISILYFIKQKMVSIMHCTLMLSSFRHSLKYEYDVKYCVFVSYYAIIIDYLYYATK